jgi:hypothetical protein
VPRERCLVFVMLMGALGSMLYFSSSFVAYVGNRTFRSSWLWFYIARPFVGGALAIIFFFIAGSGFLNSSASATNLMTIGGHGHRLQGLQGADRRWSGDSTGPRGRRLQSGLDRWPDEGRQDRDRGRQRRWILGHLRRRGRIGLSAFKATHFTQTIRLASRTGTPPAVSETWTPPAA